jgi:hypothetical protein
VSIYTKTYCEGSFELFWTEHVCGYSGLVRVEVHNLYLWALKEGRKEDRR